MASSAHYKILIDKYEEIKGKVSHINAGEQYAVEGKNILMN